MATAAASPVSASFASFGLRSLPLGGRIAKYLEYRRTVNALSGLSARVLEDIGVERYEIADVAAYHTYR
jgi:uncharacterized protein YjiS (DUF1127 family)